MSKELKNIAAVLTSALAMVGTAAKAQTVNTILTDKANGTQVAATITGYGTSDQHVSINNINGVPLAPGSDATYKGTVNANGVKEDVTAVYGKTGCGSCSTGWDIATPVVPATKKPATPTSPVPPVTVNAPSNSNASAASSSSSQAAGIIAPHVAATVKPVTIVQPETNVAPVTNSGEVKTGDQIVKQGSVSDTTIVKAAAAGVAVSGSALAPTGGYDRCTIIDQRTGLNLGVGTIGATGSIALPSNMKSRPGIECISLVEGHEDYRALITKEFQEYTANTNFDINTLPICDARYITLDKRDANAHELFNSMGGLAAVIDKRCYPQAPVPVMATAPRPSMEAAPAPHRHHSARPAAAVRPVTCQTVDRKVKICKPT